MSRANRLGMYNDVKEVADLALDHGGGEYQCATHGDAMNFTHRFYRFRKLYNEIHHSDGSPCKYDKLMLPRVPKDSSTVRLNLRQHVGTFKPATDSRAVDISADDDLFDVASSIAKKIKGVDQ